MPPNLIVRVRYLSPKNGIPHVAVVRACSYGLMNSIATVWGDPELEVAEVDVLSVCPNVGASPSLISDGPCPLERTL